MTAAETVQLAHEPPFRLGAVEVRPATREIIGPQGALGVEPRILQVLILLARSPGGVVSRQALIDGCWDGRIVGEDAINRAILKLRKLAQKTGGAFTVQTIPKVGYRLEVGARPGAETRSPAPAGPSRRTVIVTGVGAFVASGLVTAALIRRGPSRQEIEAQALYARGEAAFQQGSRADNAQATRFFERAAALSPKDGKVLGALALAYRFEQSFLPLPDMPAAMALADKATARALAVAPDDPDAVAAQSLYIPFRDHWSETERRMLDGLRRAPQSGVLHGFHGMLLGDVGRTRAAVAELQQAARLNGFVPILRRYLVRALYAAGQTTEAERQLELARSLWPQQAELWWLRFWLPALSGRGDDALAHLAARESWPAEVTDAQRAAARLSALALQSGRRADAQAALAAWRPEAAATPHLVPDIASFAAAAGERDAAFAIAQDFLADFAHPDDHRLRTPAFLFTPAFAAMRADPRLAQLFELTRLNDYWRAAGVRPDIG